MKFRLSILKIYSVVFLLACAVYTIINYQTLSEGEGWGVVGMIGLSVFALLLLVVGIAIDNIFKNRLHANMAGLIVAIAATLFVFLS